MNIYFIYQNMRGKYRLYLNISIYVFNIKK